MHIQPYTSVYKVTVHVHCFWADVNSTALTKFADSAEEWLTQLSKFLTGINQNAKITVIVNTNTSLNKTNQSQAHYVTWRHI